MSKGSWVEFDDSLAKDQAFENSPISPKRNRSVLVQKTRGGKRGKTVTVITGLELDASGARSLLKSLKSRCGAGGTVKGDSLEVQGDQVAIVLQLLIQEGYRPKQSGS